MLLLTGATGFLGSHLLRRFLEEGYQLCCIKRSMSDCGRVSDAMDACIWYDIDRVDMESIFLKHRIEAVIHCATDYGRNKAETARVYQSNLSFPLILLDCAGRHECERFINTDSFFVRQADSLWREGKKVYMADYTKSKYLFACVAREQIKRRKMAFINLRLEHVYGPGDGRNKFVSFLLKNLMCNAERLELTDGRQMRDFIYIEDVLNAYMAVLNNIKEFERGAFYQLEVGTGRETTLRAFAEKAKEITGSSAYLDFGQKMMEEGEILNSCADNRALLELGWMPQFDIAEGLRKMLQIERQIK